MRVGIRLADQMTNEQLDEFERYYENKDDAGAFKWLETNFPNYKDIVQQEFDKLKSEIAQSAPQILSASQAQSASAQPAQAVPPPPTNTGSFQQAQPPQQPLTPPQPQPQPTTPPPTQPPQPYNNDQPNYPSQQPPPGPAS